MVRGRSLEMTGRGGCSRPTAHAHNQGCINYEWVGNSPVNQILFILFRDKLVKRRGAAESSMDFTSHRLASLGGDSPPFARPGRVPRFARPGLASLGWGSLRSPEARFARLGLASLACGSLRSAGVSAYLGTVLVHMYTCTYSSIGGATGDFETHYRYVSKMRQPATRLLLPLSLSRH